MTHPALGGLGTTQPALGGLGTKPEEQKSVVSPGEIEIEGSKGKKEGYMGLQEEKYGVIDLKKDPMNISLEVTLRKVLLPIINIFLGSVQEAGKSSLI